MTGNPNWLLSPMIIPNLTLNQAKSIEQYYIQLKKGPNKLNKINSISPDGKYKAFYKDAIEWAEDYISRNKGKRK